MFFTFLALGSSKWLNYSDYNYYVYFQEESRFLPIFTLFTNSSSSDDLIPQFHFFSNTFKNDYELNFMHVDCLNSSLCLKFGIISYPSLYFIQGPNYYYWYKCLSNDFSKEISNFFGPLRYTSIEDASLSNFLESTQNGGSFFHLRIRPEFKTVLIKFKESASYYHIFNSTFAYTTTNIDAASITSYYSENCFTYRRIRPIDIDVFCDKNKFSFYHIYRSFEIKTFIENDPYIFVVFTNREDLPLLRKALLEKFNLFCHRFKFGFIQHDEHLDLLSHFSLENETVPFIFGINIFQDCYSHYPIDSNITFYNDLLDGKNCLRIDFKYSLLPNNPKARLTMLSFVTTFAITFALFYCLAINKRPKQCNYEQIQQFNRSNSIKTE